MGERVGVGRWVDEVESQMVQTVIYKISQGEVTYSMAPVVNNIVSHI